MSSCGPAPGLPAAVNFATGTAASETKRLRDFRPDGPPWVRECWAGWFDHWGENHATTNTEKQVAEYESLLKQGYSVNLYLLWGGTSFGWMNGANTHGKDYQPDVTSYDYDAPINERGNSEFVRLCGGDSTASKLSACSQFVRNFYDQKVSTLLEPAACKVVVAGFICAPASTKEAGNRTCQSSLQLQLLLSSGN
jgi:hypothetical protein